MLKRTRPRLSAFRRDQRGLAAVEFALIAPGMILLYCGLVEVCQAIIASRKTDHVAAAVGDLVTQADAVTASGVNDIFSIGNTIMSPFPTPTLQMRLTDITADANGTPKVTWSRAQGMSPMAVGQTVSLPITLNAGESMVKSESKYTYTSVLQYVLPNALSYNETYYMRPRRSDNVTCPDC
jgi:Flp pilus assembly protein TadG